MAQDEKSSGGQSSATARRFSSAGDANKELHEGFNTWSGLLASFGLNSAYASIAANWAIHQQHILANFFARASIAVAVAYLAIHLLCAGLLTLLLRRRAEHADADKDRWLKEFDENRDKGSPWPYTSSIQNLGEFVRTLHVFGPLLSGALLVASMFNC